MTSPITKDGWTPADRLGPIGDLFERDWDAVVIGAGMGGGLLGRRLAEAGMTVLFVDAGPADGHRDQDSLETDVTDPEERRARGYWPEPVEAVIDDHRSLSYGPFGSGAGGTSAFYAASLERPEPEDLDDSAAAPHPTGGWPAGYAAFAPYFEQAERLLHVNGGVDPLSSVPRSLPPGPSLSPGDALMADAFSRSGLHPYRANVGIRHLPGCVECIGRVCRRSCKMDGRSAGVEPALATGRAAVADRCIVRRLHARGDRVTEVEAVRDGVPLHFRGRCVILAAGGLGTPRLLLASASEAWPDGLANRSGLVGRNLMFHLSERIAIWPAQQGDFTGFSKSLCLRDFYRADGERYGLFQSMGLPASYGNVVQFLNDRFDRSALHRLRPLRELLRIPAFAAARLFGDARIFVGILEDLPYERNRVLLHPDHPDRPSFEYHIPPELAARRRAFRALIKRGLRGQRSFFLTFEPELNFGHPCGTTRFGTDEARSVLDPACRAHGIANLWVADPSFMPTSNGVNPSLTIAANALRVADAILAAQGVMPPGEGGQAG